MSPNLNESAADGRRPDLLAVAGGLYFGLLAAAVAVVLSAVAVAPTALTQYLLVLSVLAVVGVGAGVACSRDASARPLVRLGPTPAVWLVPLVPFAVLGVLAAVLFVGATDAPGGTVVAALLLLVATVPGFGVAAGARSRHARLTLAGATEYGGWTARLARPRRRLLAGVGTAIGLAGVLGIFAELLVGDYFWLAYFAGYGVGLREWATADREYVVTDRGLDVRRRTTRTATPWSAFDGYALDADAGTLTLTRPSPWRLSVRCDLGDIDDPEAVAAALSRVLPAD